MGRQEAAPASQGAVSAGTGAASTGTASGRPDSGVPAVRLTGVRRMYGQLAAVAGVDLDVAEGEFFTMLGPSGSGKTTLLRLIAGFGTPEKGRILVGDQDITHRPPWRRNVGMVFQNYALWPHMTVAGNVAFGLEQRRKIGRAHV